MTKLRIVNLLDDFAIGGVTNGLRVFESPELIEIGHFETVAIDPKAWLAPRLAADIILTHFPPNWRRIMWFYSLRWRNPKAQLIHVEHSYSKEWTALHVPNFTRFRTMMQIALRPMDRIVVVSKALKHWMIQERLATVEKLQVIYPYSNVPGLEDVPDIVVEPSEPLVIGAYGRFCDAKGFDLLIDAFKATDERDNLRLVIGGFGPDDAILRAKAAGCDRISFVGKVNDVACFLGQCHVLAVPSRYETYGQVANEARAAGRPILVSQAGGLPEQVHKCGVVVDCDDSEQFRNALRSLRSMPLLCMSKNARLSTAGFRAERIDQWLKLFSLERTSSVGASNVRNAIPMMSSAGQHK